MKMGIERRLKEKIPEIVAVEPIADDEETGLELKRTLYMFYCWPNISITSKDHLILKEY
jgi:hypothetical protein